MDGILELKKFKQIELQDTFFDSLRQDYQGFDKWFQSKSEELAYVLYDDKGNIDAFLYLKREVGPINDVEPLLGEGEWVKVGTLKINPHGTRLGERLVKKTLDFAIVNNVQQLYVTIFPKHTALVNLFKKYGFTERSLKHTSNGTELVLVKQLNTIANDVLLDYPVVKTKGVNKFVLSIYPQFHTRLFPDSILKNESFDIIEDTSHTNSIHKVYICSMEVSALKKGDILVMYRTKTPNTSAWYTSVATSICVVEEVKERKDFNGIHDFVKYCKDYSVYSQDELVGFYKEQKKKVYVIRMTYNTAFRKRLNRKRLVEEAGLEPDNYWGFFKLTNSQFEQIIIKGEVYESLIID